MHPKLCILVVNPGKYTLPTTIDLWLNVQWIDVFTRKMASVLAFQLMHIINLSF